MLLRVVLQPAKMMVDFMDESFTGFTDSDYTMDGLDYKWLK